MLKRNIILGMIAACFVLQIGQAGNQSTSTNLHNSTQYNNASKKELAAATNSISWDSTLNNKLPQDLIFKVVIGTFVEPLDIECSFLRKVRADLTIEKTDQGRVRYAIGAFNQYQQAESHCESLKSKGYRHAKVIAYSKEEVLSIPMNQILELIAHQ